MFLGRPSKLFQLVTLSKGSQVGSRARQSPSGRTVTGLPETLLAQRTPGGGGRAQWFLSWARASRRRVLVRNRFLVGERQFDGKHVSQQEQREEGEWWAADPLLVRQRRSLSSVSRCTPVYIHIYINIYIFKYNNEWWVLCSRLHAQNTKNRRTTDRKRNWAAQLQSDQIGRVNCIRCKQRDKTVKHSPCRTLS